MKNRLIYTFLAITITLFACQQAAKTPNVKGEAKPDSANKKEVKASLNQGPCEPGEHLEYEEPNVFSTYTEDQIRGEGIISFELDLHKRLNFYDMDGSIFGFLVLNDNQSYYTLDMPQKTVARKLVTNYDFAAFDFDAENPATNKEYLIVYVNKEKRKVKKADVKFTYTNWSDYLKNSIVVLRPCNLLKDASGKILDQSASQVFTVLDVKGDQIKIRSTNECMDESREYIPMEGWIQWKSSKFLKIDFTGCE
ncbi:hypothetical protein [Pedobacter boryungensis]|uniref:Lipoprotein n=1 Tax=Pedobacter boryungensis TaxID=869962 RepID=A0ABX2D9B7_9SPHI|nr:hypothetical protein [Pedobacter boryungensis]NQX30570.1 hypothetical protein [Pedobacter boryungensis]